MSTLVIEYFFVILCYAKLLYVLFIYLFILWFMLSNFFYVFTVLYNV